MGIIDEIKALDLADDVKEKLIREHQAEINPLKETNDSLLARSRKESVNTEVAQLSELGFDEAPGLLKFYRRVLLSADAEEPGAVLLSDGELELSGDEATGATGREEISVAGALRKFVELMPRNQEGKLNLSDQVHANENLNRPETGDPNDPDARKQARTERASRLAGRPVNRTRSRYGVASSVSEGV